MGLKPVYTIETKIHLAMKTTKIDFKTKIVSTFLWLSV